MKTKAGVKRLLAWPLVPEEALSPCGGAVRGKLTPTRTPSSCAVQGRLTSMGKMTKMGQQADLPATSLACLMLMTVSFWSCVNGSPSSRKPNIVLILTDDLDVAIGGMVSLFCIGIFSVIFKRSDLSFCLAMLFK